MEPKKISKTNLPEGIVIAFDIKGRWVAGKLERHDDGTVSCLVSSLGTYDLHDCTHYIAGRDVTKFFKNFFKNSK